MKLISAVLFVLSGTFIDVSQRKRKRKRKKRLVVEGPWLMAGARRRVRDGEKNHETQCVFGVTVSAFQTALFCDTKQPWRWLFCDSSAVRRRDISPWAWQEIRVRLHFGISPLFFFLFSSLLLSHCSPVRLYSAWPGPPGPTWPEEGPEEPFVFARDVLTGDYRVPPDHFRQYGLIIDRIAPTFSLGNIILPFFNHFFNIFI